MTTTMIMTTSRPDWQPGHVPKLAYRNAIPSESSIPAGQTEDEDNQPSLRIPPNSSIREIRQSLPRSPSSMTTTRPFQPQPTPRKKSSLFGGLFVKEPTMAALDQVAAQLVDKHGSISPRTVPHVSSAKMPQHVPKVNSKWDGVPEAVKVKGKQARESTKTSNRKSFLPGIINTSQSTGVSDERPPMKRLSTVDSWDSRSTGSRPVFQDNPPRTNSSYSTDFDSSDPNPQLAASVKSQSLRSPSGSSLPEITAFFPGETLAPLKSNLRCAGVSTYHTTSTSVSNKPGLERPQSNIFARPSEQVLESVTASSSIPFNGSAPASFPILNDPNMNITTKRQGVVMPADVTIPTEHSSSRRKSALPLDAFLAGEAKPLELSDDESGCGPISPVTNSMSRKSKADSIAIVQQDLEKRPDSSRARLGLRVSMIVQNDVVPWNPLTIDSQTSQSPRSPTSPRARFKLFGKDKT